jgi:hypothetical protein
VAYGPHFTFEINSKDNGLTTMKDSKNISKKLGLIGVGLCAACCLLPIAAVSFGIGALTVLGAYMGWVGLLAIISAAAFLVLNYLRKKHAQACDTDCVCKKDRA